MGLASRLWTKTRSGLLMGAICTFGSTGGGANADPPESPATNTRGETSTPQSGASGSRGFEARGITLELISKVDLLSKLRGGLSSNTVASYRGHVDLVVTMDAERLGLWRGGTFVLLVAQNGHGDGLSAEHLGDVQTLSNIDARSFTQMSEWFLEQALLDDRLRVKVGRQDAAVDFGFVDFGAEFLNSSFGVIPTNPLPTFPDPAIGVSVFADVAGGVSVGVGVYSPAPLGERMNGTTFGLEVGYVPRRSGQGGRGTKYRAGLWHQRDGLDMGPRRTSSVYAAIDQVFFREEAEGQGLSGFLQIGMSSGAPNGVSSYLGAGVLYTGLLPGRDEDRLGLGVAHARLPPRVGRGSAETDIELMYRASPWRWLALQPSIHWLLRPDGQRRSAVVVGLRVETGF